MSHPMDGARVQSYLGAAQFASALDSTHNHYRLQFSHNNSKAKGKMVGPGIALQMWFWSV